MSDGPNCQIMICHFSRQGILVYIGISGGNIPLLCTILRSRPYSTLKFPPFFSVLPFRKNPKKSVFTCVVSRACNYVIMIVLACFQKNVLNSRNPCAGALVVLGFVPGGTYGCVFFPFDAGHAGMKICAWDLKTLANAWVYVSFSRKSWSARNRREFKPWNVQDR